MHECWMWRWSGSRRVHRCRRGVCAVRRARACCRPAGVCAPVVVADDAAVVTAVVAEIGGVAVAATVVAGDEGKGGVDDYVGGVGDAAN